MGLWLVFMVFIWVVRGWCLTGSVVRKSSVVRRRASRVISVVLAAVGHPFRAWRWMICAGRISGGVEAVVGTSFRSSGRRNTSNPVTHPIRWYHRRWVAAHWLRIVQIHHSWCREISESVFNPKQASFDGFECFVQFSQYHSGVSYSGIQP